MKAGFAEIDITPPEGIQKIGWMQELRGEIILDPLYARVAVFDDGNKSAGFIQLDTLSIRWTQVNGIRERIKKKLRFPSENIMVSATHNHAGPAVSNLSPYQTRDEKYIEELTEKCVKAFETALSDMEEVQIGTASTFNFEVAHNRRCRMKDGTVKTQKGSANPLFLCLEGPADPEVFMLAARNSKGKIKGALLNYACHPTDHGGTNEISAGFPGVVADKMKSIGCPVSLYLNGAYGNVITVDFEKNKHLSMENAGTSLFNSFKECLEKMEFSENSKILSAKDTLRLNYRNFSEEEIKGKVFGAQRFRSDEYYEAFINNFIEKAKIKKTQPVEVQIIKIGDTYFSGVPAEYFVEYQLLIKEKTYPLKSYVIGGANGMIGYVPTKEAFNRGGYETTFGPPSHMSPETGDKIAEKIIEIIKGLK